MKKTSSNVAYFSKNVKMISTVKTREVKTAQKTELFTTKIILMQDWVFKLGKKQSLLGDYSHYRACIAHCHSMRSNLKKNGPSPVLPSSLSRDS